MTLRVIEETIKEMYGIEVSEGSISNITNAVVENIKEWQQRPLEPVYFVVWMDSIVIKIRQNGKVQGKTIYLMIGQPSRLSIWPLRMSKKNGPTPFETGVQLLTS